MAAAEDAQEHLRQLDAVLGLGSPGVADVADALADSLRDGHERLCFALGALTTQAAEVRAAILRDCGCARSVA